MSPPSSSTSPGSVAESITTLVDWAVSLGATLHPSVEVYDDAQTGLSFRVKPSAPHPVQAFEPIVQLPATLSLSYLDAVAQQKEQQDDAPFAEEVLTSTPPHVVGRLFLVREYLRGRSSFWWPYIQALPQPGLKDRHSWALPPFWDADEAELLDGTNVEVGIAKVRQDVQSEFAHARKLLSACAVRDPILDEGLTTDLYQWAYCIFASRSFRPSLVLLDARHKALLPAGVAMDDFSVLLPLMDVGNHDMTVNVRWELDHDAEQCSLRVGKEHQPGEQVFNNYGLKTNAELLLGYGFMVPASEALHNDYIHVRKRGAPGPQLSNPSNTSQDSSDPSTSSNASHEYLISLRPLAHPSTLLARARQSIVISFPPDLPLLGSFQHVQLEMVWDILCTLTSSSQRRFLMPVPVGQDREPDDVDSFHRRLFFSGHVGASAREVLGQTIAIIQHQLLQELERLNETDVEVVDGVEADLTGNQRLALDYRARCRRVLEGVLEAMDGDDVFGDEE
ncbi:hypothetical protein E4U61_007783 [Claviceps capensis]|nr:hypothetical protein E4U61_007783 [Claviceps capensis]